MTIHTIFKKYFIAIGCTAAFLLWSSIVFAQTPGLLDPKRIAQIDTAITIEMPAEEDKWWIGRGRMEDAELEFRRDTFRVNRMQCHLTNDLEEYARAEQLVAIYQYVASRYEQLIDKYDALARKCKIPELRDTYIQSQESWLNYRKQTLALFSDNPEDLDKSLQRLTMNRQRLAEIYFFYSEWDYEGLIRKD